MSILFLTLENCRFVKRSLSERLPQVKSTHLSEALAAALGFRTHAALLAALKTTTPERPALAQVDQDRMQERLCQLGYGPKVSVDLVNLTRSHELPLAAWREFGHRDRAANNAWFEECQRRNIPNVCIRLRTKYSKLSWDCISIDPAFESHVRDAKGDALIDVLFDRFQAFAKGSPGKPVFFGSAFVGTADNLLPSIARDLADDYFVRLYTPMKRQIAA